MGLIDVGDAIAVKLSEIEGLRAYKPSEMPDSINDLPAVVVLVGATPYHTAFGGDFDHNLRIMLLLSKADTPSAFRRLYDYIAATGTKSIKAKLEEDGSFGGACDDSMVGPNSGAGQTVWGGVPYLSSEWPIFILM